MSFEHHEIWGSRVHEWVPEPEAEHESLKEMEADDEHEPWEANMIFYHNESRKPAIQITTARHSPDAVEIKEPDDLLPLMDTFRQVNIDPYFIDKGCESLYMFLREFLATCPNRFYVWVFKSNFPEANED